MSSRALKHADVLSTVETRCPAGHPQVLRCHPLRTGEGRFAPFPTQFWLVCPQLTYALSRLEHDGWITRLQDRIREDETFRLEVAGDHARYADERWAMLSSEEQEEVRRRGLESDLRERGIGGTRDRNMVKCLHLHYAFHLARGSAIGRVLDDLGVLAPCVSPPPV
ncbi:MAG: DUF501 domain-containing protein [Planctomycetota bacterium]|nr:DUF501 domain-containing protein [Planctomycetota bacterium]